MKSNDSEVFFEEDCLRILATEDESARTLLLTHMPNAARRFARVDAALCRLLSDVRRTFPDAEYYTGSGGFNLLIGKSHSDKSTAPQQQLIALIGKATIGDGDW